jgi:DNA primase small subunit
MGKGFKLETLGIKVDKEKNAASLLKSKRLLDLGWRGRILKYLKLNVSTIKNNNALTKYIEKLESTWNCSFQQMVSKAVEDLSVKLDPVVTMDIHRIFRLNGSLNSKSGLAKIICSDIDSFDPFKEACFYGKSEVEIDSKVDSTIYFNGKKFVLNNGFNVIPEYLATYLISKGLVNINLKETK